MRSGPDSNFEYHETLVNLPELVLEQEAHLLRAGRPTGRAPGPFDRQEEAESSKGLKFWQSEGMERRDCMKTRPAVPGDLLGISVFVL